MLDTNQENTEDPKKEIPEINEAEATNSEVLADESTEDTEVVAPVNEDKSTTDKAVEEIEENVAKDAEKDAEKNTIPMLDYESMDLEALVVELDSLLNSHPIQQLKNNVEALKNSFNAKFGKILADKKAAFLEEGGNSIDFQFSSPIKSQYNALLSKYKKNRDAYYADLDVQLKGNLEKRHIVIRDLKELIENADPKTMYKTFRAIQTKWREIGPVPRNKYNDTWRNYHHHVERFYDLLHLSNDYRDSDFKHNLEEKLKLIQKVEALVERENIHEAFKELQGYHKAWKEDIGPVSKEFREEVWQKFSAASKKIHDKRHEHFKSLKTQYQGIIDKKMEVIAAIDLYDTSKNAKHSDWQRSIKEIEAFRQQYFDAGKLPYSKSEEVWQKFKAATKKFNQAKNAFYKNEKGIQQANLDKKNALIALAESIKDSDDWDVTTNTMKKIQADWKKIGHVPRKFSDDIWKKFKTACNHYFDRYHNRQNDLNKEQQAFIDDKKEYLEKLKAVDSATIEEINSFIKEWRELGDLPRSVRHLEAKFNKHIDKLLEGLSLKKDEIALLKFKNMVDSYLSQNDARKLNSELMFVRKKIDESIKEVQQLENNLSFFSNAKDDNPLVMNVKSSIEKHKEAAHIWKQKLAYLKTLNY